jgi:hypothetical protein
MATKRTKVITGVARGGLGTGTALDDTQVYDVAALNAPEADAPEAGAPEGAALEAVAPEAVVPRISPQPAVARPVARREKATRTTSRSTGPPQHRAAPRGTFPGPVWLAGGAVAAVLVFGLLGAALGNPRPGAADGAGLDGGSNLPAVIATPSNPPDEGGNGKGNGRGGGNGHGNGGGD